MNAKFDFGPDQDRRIVYVRSVAVADLPEEVQSQALGLETIYALHDALVKPLPGKAMAPSLAESWSASPDGLTYDFVLRQGVRWLLLGHVSGHADRALREHEQMLTQMAARDVAVS